MHSVLAVPQEVRSLAIGTLGAFFEDTPSLENDLTRNQERLIKELLCALDKQLLSAVESRTYDEFNKVRKTAWPRYIRALRALQDTMNNFVGADVIETLTAQVLPGLNSDIQKQTGRFGEVLTEQAIFTLWTIGKIRALAQKIDAIPVPPDKRDKNQELFGEYSTNCLWSQFHLDVLFVAMKFNRLIVEDIRATMLDGLRASVNAYAIMKEALALRQPQAEASSPVTLPWDDEDERLLAASMRDVNADFSDDNS